MKKLFVLVLVILAVVIPGIANAQPAQRGIRITPLRTYLAQDPGNTSAASVTVTNDTDKPVRVKLSSENFTVTNEAYDYGFDVSESAGWIRFVDQQLVLEPGASQKVSYSLAVPTTASPGGHYIALFASTEEEASTTAVTEVKRVASLVYLEVSGHIIKKGQLLGIDIPWLTTNPQVPIVARVANQGNTHMQNRVGITATPMFGGTKYITQLEGLTLPNTIRRISGEVIMGRMPGIYKVSATYAPPQGGNTVHTSTLIYMPPWFVLSVGLALLLFGYFLFGKLRHRRKR